MISDSVDCYPNTQLYTLIHDHPALRGSATTIPSRNDNSPSSDILGYQSTRPNGLRSSPEMHHSESHKSLNSGLSQTKPYTHGQAEQLRRSRESSTFTLIDSQLSKPPFSRVRDMYLQTRSGNGSSGNGSAARTTKKANLSVVHTVVRFRIKEHLLAAQEHLKQLLDTLVQDTDNQIQNRSTLKSLCSSCFQCSNRCQFCTELSEQASRTPKCDKRPHSVTEDRVKSNILKPENKPAVPFKKTIVAKRSMSNHSTLQPHTISSQSIVESKVDCHPPAFDFDPLSHWLFDESQKPLLLTKNNLDKTLPSYLLSNDELGIHTSKRTRLDSTTLRLTGEFDITDWSAEDINLGPVGEDPVDLHTLINDPFVMKCEDTSFDPAFDMCNDLLQQFGIDRHFISLANNSP